MGIRLEMIPEIVAEIDGAKFYVRPQEYTDLAKALAMVSNLNVLPGDERVRNVIVGSYVVGLRVFKWSDDIINQDGEPIEYSDEAKWQLFGQRPDILNQIVDQVTRAEGREEKNSGSTQDG